jgi:hypothetical protein
MLEQCRNNEVWKREKKNVWEMVTEDGAEGKKDI